MTCTKEEIERKRLAALQKRQIKLIKNLDGESPSSLNSNVGPVKNHNTHISFHPYAKNVKNDRNISSSSKIVPGKFYNSQNNARENTKVSQENVEKNRFESSGETNYHFQSKQSLSQVVTAKVYLISEHRFEVSISEFCMPLINIFKSMPSGHYDANNKLWNFSINDYQEFITKTAHLEPHVVVNPLPQFVLKILKFEIQDPNTVDLLPIEETLRNKLMPFQQDGVRFAIARRGRCMIADEMGLGKTFQGLAIASYYRRDWPLLIVTTSSMRETWQSKIHELLPSVPMSNIAILANSKDGQLVADKQTEVVITSFKISISHKELLQNKKFGVIIVDESHNLKSYKAQCTSTIMGIAGKCARALLLSGTPALSRPAELYTQLALIENGLFSSYNSYIQFGVRYCDGKQTNFGWDMSGESNLGELQVILRKRFLIRRTKDEVLTDLGQITRETVILDQTLLDYTKEDERELTQMADDYNKSSSSERHAALLTYFSRSAAVKIPAVCKYIKQLLKEYTGKFLVFAHHRAMVEALCDTLTKTRTKYICIVGSTPASSRAELVDRFQHGAGVRAAVLSITAAGAGLTLTAAGLVLFAELHWNPGVLTQAEARAHRVGRAGGVAARYLLARGSADDAMWPMLHGKLQVLNGAGLSGENFEDTAVKHQESKNTITQYLSPKPVKNKNDYIPGTNILKSSQKFKSQETNNTQKNTQTKKTNETNIVSLNSSDSVNVDEVDEFIMNYEKMKTQKTPNNTQPKTQDETDIISIHSSDSMRVDEVDEFIMNYDEDDDLLAGLSIDL